MTIKCEEVIVQLVIRTYDDAGRPVQEQVSQAQKVFRSGLHFWDEVDKAVAAMQTTPAASPDPAQPAREASRKRRR